MSCHQDSRAMHTLQEWTTIRDQSGTRRTDAAGDVLSRDPAVRDVCSLPAGASRGVNEHVACGVQRLRDANESSGS